MIMLMLCKSSYARLTPRVLHPQTARLARPHSRQARPPLAASRMLASVPATCGVAGRCAGKAIIGEALCGDVRMVA